MRYEFEKLQMMQRQSDIVRDQSRSVTNRDRMGSGHMQQVPNQGGMQMMTPVNSELLDMQNKMQQMLDAQKAHLAVTKGQQSGTSQADNDTTDWQDETEYSDDDEMAQMRAKMKELARSNSDAFGAM